MRALTTGGLPVAGEGERSEPERQPKLKQRSAERSEGKAKEAAKHIDTSDIIQRALEVRNKPLGLRGRAKRARALT